jgi:phosphoribosylaminoimidazolecarboxamide formyltransferase/IMP cyclohydrolase
MKTALLASYGKDAPLLRLGKMLRGKKWQLLGSAGTAKYLNENGVPCRDVAEIIGAPILGHRVVTLAREIYAGLLAATPEDFAELEKQGITPIDLVYATLYPLEATIADKKSTPHDVIEKTDIGGPTLLRAAAKGRRVVVSDPSQIDDVEKWLAAGGENDEKLLTHFAAAAERRVAEYVDASASYWEKQ